MRLKEAEEFINYHFQTRLPDKLYYHNYDHTIYVLQSAIELAAAEDIINERELLLLKTAALFHDCGYLNTYENHEEESCRIARIYLPEFGYSPPDIDLICSMIMKTKMPQQPQTLLEHILCDADLYYLGGDDFETSGHKLFKEWVAMGKLNNENEWNQMQIKFLESHHYWTNAARANRNNKKIEHLEKLKVFR